MRSRVWAACSRLTLIMHLRYACWKTTIDKLYDGRHE
jgi:hypothetical protein